MHKTIVFLSILFTPLFTLAAIGTSQTQIDFHADPLNFGQSFTPTEDQTISAIRLSIAAEQGGSDFTLQFYEFDRGTLTLAPTVLATGQAFESQLSRNTPSWLEIRLASPLPILSGQTYAFTVLAKGPGGDTGWNNYGLSTTDVYAGGEFFFGLTGSVRVNTNLKELAFETVVPEPASFTALLLLICLMISRKRNSLFKHGENRVMIRSALLKCRGIDAFQLNRMEDVIAALGQ